MRRSITVLLLLLFTLPALSLEETQVTYQGGTLPGLIAGATGTLDASSETVLQFRSGTAVAAIPYLQIRTYEYSSQLARHLGVLPALAAGLVRKRQRRHFLRLTYERADQASQVAVFEIPKQMPRTLLAVLAARAPQARREAGRME